MISSRWPRPIGIIESMALMPVAQACVSTDCAVTTFGAIRSTGRRPGRRDRALAVDRLAERVDDAADQRVADRHLGDAAGRADLVALLDADLVAEDDDADGVFFEVEGQPRAPFANWTSSPDMTPARPKTRAMPSWTSMTVPTSAEQWLAEALDLCSDDRADLVCSHCHCAPATSLL